jgi:multidrug efflux pump subunit AcrB
MADPVDPSSAEAPEPVLPRGAGTRGPLAWFARNTVVANILLLVLLLGGGMRACQIKQEVFPEFTLDLIVINVPYPGASPAEVESGVLQAVEEAVRSIDGVKEVRSTAIENFGVVTIELLLGTPAQEALDEAKSAVDRITSLPEQAEKPVIFRAKNRFQVISLVLFGEQSELALRRLAERARDELLQDPRITTVELAAIRPYEISIEIPEETLRRYGLTIDQIAAIIRASSVELPAGAIKTRGGEVLVRTSARRDRAIEYEDVIVVSRPDGTTVRLGELAAIRDGFAETDSSATFNGKPAVMVNVYRIGEQKPTEVAEAVKDYQVRLAASLPPGVEVATWFDGSEFLQGRIDLLSRNAKLGLILVLLILGLFLEVRLAFWVTIGIPASFLGAMLLLPAFDVSINMISLFAFILVLGMVVDDAIVIGEAIYARRQEGVGRIQAAIFGVRQMAVPVVFAILTTIIAYTPLLFVPGASGKFFRQIPIVVILTLLISLVEALLILPAHLAASKESKGGVFGWIDRQQQRFGRFLERFIEGVYVPTLHWALRRRYLTFAIALAMLLGTCGVVGGGHLKFTFMPQIESDVIVASVELPFGAPVERTRAIEARIVAAAQEVLAETGGPAISRGLFSQIGAAGMLGGGGPRGPSGGDSGGHLAETAIYLVPIDQRQVSAAEFARRWRARLGELPGVERLSMNFETASSGGKPIAIELSHGDDRALEAAARDLAGRLEAFTGVYDIDSGFTGGKPQLDLELKPEARALGLTELELARQVRAAYFGAEAARQQRGRDEVRTFVRLPLDERESEYGFEQMIIRTPAGGEMPLGQAAEVRRGRSYTSIERINGRRAVTVTAMVDQTVANAQEINADLMKTVLPALVEDHPRLSWSFGGEQKQQAEIFGSLKENGILALLAIFGLLAIVFRSYVQPAIIMSAIPFGFIGAVVGHILFGYHLSLMSMMGLVALMGVVVNDALVYIDAVNEFRREGHDIWTATVVGGARRFRPILLTSLTTFGGLMPMLLETSLQARFLIPMAISLGCGVLFATFTTLLLVPALYLIVEDARRGLRWLVAFVLGRPTPPPALPRPPVAEVREPRR